MLAEGELEAGGTKFKAVIILLIVKVKL